MKVNVVFEHRVNGYQWRKSSDGRIWVREPSCMKWRYSSTTERNIDTALTDGLLFEVKK
jgi:hypothetical protein